MAFLWLSTTHWWHFKVSQILKIVHNTLMRIQLVLFNCQQLTATLYGDRPITLNHKWLLWAWHQKNSWYWNWNITSVFTPHRWDQQNNFEFTWYLFKMGFLPSAVCEWVLRTKETWISCKLTVPSRFIS